MKNKICITIVSIVLVLLQVTVFEYFKISDIKPDIILIFMVLLGLYGKVSDLFFCGIICGILQDMTLSKTVGVYLIINLIFCFILSERKNKFERKSFVSLLGASFMYFLIYSAISFIICSFPRTLNELVFVMKNYVAFGAVYNTACSCIIFAILKIKDSMGENYVRKVKR